MKKQTGFTIIELIVTLAMVAILAGFAVPALQDLISNNRSTAQANSFLTALTLARSEAIKRRESVSVVAADDSSGTNEWGPGWEIQDSAGNPIRVFEATTGSTLDSQDDVSSVSFDLNGMATSSLKFELMPDNNDTEFARCIEMTKTGRAAVQHGACS